MNCTKSHKEELRKAGRLKGVLRMLMVVAMLVPYSLLAQNHYSLDTVIRNCAGTTTYIDVEDLVWGGYYSEGFTEDTVFVVRYPRLSGDSLVRYTLIFDTLFRDSVFCDSLCKGKCYRYRDATFCSDGLYPYKWQNDGDGCWNKSVIELIFNDTFNIRLPDTNICLGELYYFCDSSGFVDGMNVCKLKTIHGCDSVVRQKITLRDTSWTDLYDTICAGGTYTHANRSYTITIPGPHIRNQHYPTAFLCDSVISLNIFVRDTLRDTIWDTICAGATFDTNGHMGYVPISGRNYSPYYLQGVYTQYLRDTSNGCLHNLVICLTVNDTLRDTIRTAICKGQTFDTNYHLGFSPVSGQRYGPYSRQGVYTQYLRHPTTRCFMDLVIELTVHDTFNHVRRETICAGATYTIGDSSYTRQGVYPQHYTSVHGCDSTVNLRLTVNDTLRDTVRREICAGASFTPTAYPGFSPVGGQSYGPYTQQGVYRQYLRNSNGCFRTRVIELTVRDTFRTQRYDTICAGQVFRYEGRRYTTTQSFVYRHTSRYGCDSNVVVNLFVCDTFRTHRYDTICAGNVFSYEDRGYYRAGRYVYRHRTRNGCDSNVVIHLFVLDTFRTVVYDTICRGGRFTYGNKISYSPANASLHDTVFVVGLETVHGCDSTVVIRLHINDTFRTSRYDTICRGNTFSYGRLFNYLPNNPDLHDTTIVYRHSSMRNCDSNVVINLHISDTFRTMRYDTVCRNHTFTYHGNNGNVVSYRPRRTGFNDTVIVTVDTTRLGCDSTVVIRLHINDTFQTSRHDTICRGTSFTYGGLLDYRPHNVNLHDTAIVYTHSSVRNCDSSVVIYLHINDTFQKVVCDTICRNQAFSYIANSGNDISYMPQRTGFNDTTIVIFDTTRFGCDSTVEIRLYISDTFRTRRFDTICRNRTYTYNGNNGNAINYMPHRVGFNDTVILTMDTTRFGCDSTIEIHLHINDTFRTLRYDTICRNQTYTYIGNNGNVISYIPHRTGFNDTTILAMDTTRFGCDSTIEIRLHINDTFRTLRYDTICRNQTFNYNGNNGNVVSYIPQRTGFNDTTIVTIDRTVKGCDSTIEIHLHINDTFRSQRYDTICRNQTYTYNGNNGNVISYIPHRTGFNDTTIVTIDRSEKGCDSTIEIHLYINDTFRTLRYDTICRNQTYTYSGNNGNIISYIPHRTGFNDTTIVTIDRTVKGCDSTIEIRLHINDTVRDTVRPVVCAGGWYDVGSHRYYTQGVHIDSLVTVNGCDSIIVVDLTVNDTLRDSIRRVICKGESFDTIGAQYSSTGDYVNRYRKADSCYSNLYINLLVLDTTHIRVDTTICAGSVYTYGDSSYYQPGSYYQVIRNSNYCDIVFIDISVLDTVRDTIYPVICNGKTFDTNGTSYYQNGCYTQYLRDPSTHCFNNLVIALTVNDTFRDYIFDTICAGAKFTHNGTDYTLAGNHLQHYSTVHGCDSNVMIVLTVLDTLRDTITPTICAGASFDTNGHKGCVPIDGLSYDPYTVQGVYTQYLRDTVSHCFQNLVIELTVNDTLRDTLWDTICAGASFDTNGHKGCVPTTGRSYAPYTVQGVYTQHLRDTVSHCYQNLVIVLTVNDTLRDTLWDTICAGTKLDTNGHKGCVPVNGRLYAPYTVQGVYTQYLRDTVSHCFQNLVINLTVSDTLSETIQVEICAGAKFDTNGHLGYRPVSGVDYPPYYRAGVYTQHLRTPDSCYFNLIIDLSVTDTLYDTLHAEICAGAKFDTNGHLGYRPVSGVNYPPYYHQGVYTQHLRTPDSCYYNLVIDLIVNDTLRDTIHPVICAGAKFDTNGHLGYSPVSGVNYAPYYVQGYYTQHLRTPDSCFYNLVIDLTVIDTLRDTIHPVICAGARFDTNGHLGYSPVSGVNYGPYYVQGYYTQHLRTPDSCYYNLVIDLTVNDTLRDTIHPVICAGARFDTNGHMGYSPVSGVNYGPYYFQGFHTQHLRAPDSCFHNLVIDLTVNDTLRDTVHREVCAGASFDTNGVEYYFPGYHTQHLRDPDSCFRNLVVHLTVRDTIRDTIHREICFGTTWDTNGITYSRTGYYTQYFRDSITRCYRNLVIHLIVDPQIITHLYRTICMGDYYLFNRNFYIAQGDYSHLSIAANGCDSTTVLHLRVLDTAVVHIYDTIYNNYFAYRDTIYYQPGVYNHLIDRGLEGCDSVVVLHLLLCDSLKTVIYDTVCNDSAYRFNGQMITRSGRYLHDTNSWMGCDSLVTLNLVMVDYPTLEITDSGNYCNDGKAVFTANTNGNYVTWYAYPADSSLTGQEHNTTIRVTPTEYTVYTVVADSLGSGRAKRCAAKATVEVNKASMLKARMRVIPEKLSVMNNPFQFIDISLGEVSHRRWLFSESDFDYIQQEVVDDSVAWYRISDATDSLLVRLVVSNDYGCVDTVDKVMLVADGDLWAPNAFTPGNDKNYLFKVAGFNVIEYEINIYNRGGLLVYHGEDINESWDGTHKGQDCVEGSYVYVIKYRTKANSGEVLKKVGSVLLIR